MVKIKAYLPQKLLFCLYLYRQQIKAKNEIIGSNITISIIRTCGHTKFTN